MRERTPVAVVVVTWNSAQWVGACLESLGRLSRAPEDVVVVDSGSDDDTVSVLRARFPEVTAITFDENVGYCRANNVGIARTTSPFVLLLNPDTRLEKEFLENLLAAFDDPRVGMAAGKLLRFDGRTIDSAGQALARSRRPLDRGYGRPDVGQFDSDGEVFGVCGAAALYRRAMLDSVAGPDGKVFDEDFFAFFEDLDLAWRARRKGWKAAYRHRAVGFHARGSTARPVGRIGRWAAMLGRSPEIRFHVVKNRYLTILRNDTLGGYLRDLPFILTRDLLTLALLLVSSPGVLVRLWRERHLFARAVASRRLDSVPSEHQTLPEDRGEG